MGKIDLEKYKQSSDIVSPDDIEGNAIVTIAEFNDGERKDKEGMWALLKFEELEDKIMWLNDAALETLVEKFGDDTDDWIGEQIPIETYSTKNGERVRIMASEEWEQAFKDAGVSRSAKNKKKSGVKK